ncbi:MAG: hypothetical protein N3G22_00165, partial [Candidatus Micrarchaeota archaeon]|nr:hypothetical protein [Candidatus Micrarchaeota archaeon]
QMCIRDSSYTEPCVRLCLLYREKPYILYQETEELICNNCPAMALYTLSGLLSLLSWVYVFVRLYLIHKNNIMELRLI